MYWPFDQCWSHCCVQLAWLILMFCFVHSCVQGLTNEYEIEESEESASEEQEDLQAVAAQQQLQQLHIQQWMGKHSLYSNLASCISFVREKCVGVWGTPPRHLSQ